MLSRFRSRRDVIQSYTTRVPTRALGNFKLKTDN